MRRALAAVAMVVVVATIGLGVAETTGLRSSMFGSDRAGSAATTAEWDSKLELCAGLSAAGGLSREACLQEVLTDVVQSRSFPAVEETLTRLSATFNGFRGDCHKVTHQLGELMRERYDDAIIALVKDSAPRVCGDGLAHAVMESFGRTVPVDDARWADLARACDSYVGGSDDRGDGCAHGFGHGVFLAHQDVQTALRFCQSTLQALTPRAANPATMNFGCSYGVLMSAYADGGLSVVDLADPEQVVRECVPWRSIEVTDTEVTDPLVESLYRGCMQGAGFALGNHVVSQPQPRDEVTKAMVDLCEEGIADGDVGGDLCASQVLMWAAPALWTDAATYHRFCSELEVVYGAEMFVNCIVSTENSLTASRFQELLDHDPVRRAELDAARRDYGR